MRKKTTKEKLLAIFLAVAVAVTMIPGSFMALSQDAHAASTKVLYKNHAKMKFYSTYSKKYTYIATFYSSDGYEGICAGAHRDSVDKATYEMRSTSSMSKSNAMGKMAWFAYSGYKNPSTGKKITKYNGEEMNNNQLRGLMSRAFTYYSTDTKTDDRGDAVNFSAKTIQAFYNAANAWTSANPIPDWFHVYYAYMSNKKDQPAVIWKATPAKAYLVKTSAVKGYKKSFKDIEYTVYKSNKSTVVGKLVCKADGTTNTLTLDPGTYYVKETSLGGNPYYKINSSWITAKLTANNTTVIKATDTADGNVSLQKSFTPDSDDGYTLGGFLFNFKSKTDGKVYPGTTNASGKVDISGMPPGKYAVTEVLTAEQQDEGYSNESKQGQIITIENGKTTSMTWKNSYTKSTRLEIVKTTSDGSPVDGFHFDVKGDIDGRDLTLESFTAYAHITPTTTKEGFTLGDFTVNEEELADLNAAAANKETGTSTVHVTATATKPAEQVEGKELSEFKDGDNYVFAEGDAVKYGDDVYIAQAAGTYTQDDIDGVPGTPSVLQDETKFKKAEAGEDETETITVPVKVTLKSITEKDNITNPTTPNSISEPEGWVIEYNDITWAGAADTYHKNDAETTTDETGSIKIKDLFPGTYTVTEELTDVQKKQYKRPEAQTKVIKEDESAIFPFENVPKLAQVVLKKTNAREGGPVEGFEFTLTGTRDYDGEAVNVTAATSEDGSIDFGNLSPGDYVLEETGFDPDNYMFHKEYRLEGHEKPAVSFRLDIDDEGNWTATTSRDETINGTEEEPYEVAFENDPVTKLYITKVDKDTQLFLRGAVFDLYEDGNKVVRFRIARDKNGMAAAVIEEKYDENSLIFADQAELEEDAVDTENPIVVDGNTEVAGEDTVTGNSVTAMADDTQQTGDNGSGEPAAGEGESGGEGDNSEAAEEAVVYNYAVLKGLKRGSEYRLVETKAPAGYSASIDTLFTFEEDMQPIIVENTLPEIGTQAKDKVNGSHMASTGSGEVTLVDTINYKKLTPNKEYKIKGVLMVKPEATEETGIDDSENVQPVIVDGKQVENTITFTASETGEGSVDVEFKVDAMTLAGMKTVFFEDLYDPELTATIDENSEPVATHAEPNNEDQSIYFTDLHTSAKGEDTETNIVGAGEDTVIIDTVEYKNVVAGKVYEITGTLMNKETGKPIKVDGENVTGSVTFKATENGPDYDNLTEDEMAEVKLVSGTAEVTFTFDSTEFAGDDLVVFESMYLDGKIVGEHKDIKDKKQTVHVPIIGTKASAGRNVIKDKVAYKNLIPGKRYIMRGKMMNKDTGAVMTVDGEELTAELEFTPKKSSGIVTLTFDVNTKKLKGKTLVAFEKCYIIADESGEEVEIAAHENLDSKAQTVTFKTPQTGQVLPWFIFAALAAMIASAGYMLRRKFFIK